MTEAELAAIEERWSSGADVRIERDGDRLTASAPYAADAPALVAEVRRLRGKVEAARGEVANVNPYMHAPAVLARVRDALSE